ncbi:sulfatase [Polaribacter atrinae]|uniref:sulfatase n=1 Tax=Polaribacter atrinae TaxID=1333662 RepID=UPI0024930291|nr:sulfatase [Polaribacter atrinae]
MKLRINLFLFVFTLLFTSCNKSEINNKPNVIFIIADDLGYADIGVYGSSFYDTPNIDALIKKGVQFTNGYSNSPVCSPARASFQTGKYPIKTGVTDWIKGRKAYQGTTQNDRWIVPETDYELKQEEVTIAEKLKENGYKTIFSGKWHLGEDEKFWPEKHGYDINIGGWKVGSPNKRKGFNGYFSPYGNPRLKDGPIGEYLPDRLTDEAIKVLKQEEGKPFFLCLSYYLVHAPFQAKEADIKIYDNKRLVDNIENSPEFLEPQLWMKSATGKSSSYKERIKQGHPTYAAMVKSLDDNVGRLINYLKESNNYENSLIVFVSDNGGLSTSEGSPTSNLPLAKGKGWMKEGGIRVPFFIKTPNQKNGLVSETPVSGIDIFPTILEYVNISNSINIDGVSLKKTIENPLKITDRPIFWHYPHYSNQGGNPSSAIRLGNYKLIHDIETETYELYNLKNDIGENSNLIDEEPKVATLLKDQLKEYITTNYKKSFRVNPNWNQIDITQ